MATPGSPGASAQPMKTLGAMVAARGMIAEMRVVLLAMSILPAFGQVTSGGPSFEVASVKPSAMINGAYGVGLFTFPGGRIVANMCKVDYLIQEAFDIQPFQIVGGPRWIHEDRFDIEAKPPALSQSSKSKPNNFKLPPNPEQRLMLWALLADRFGLRCHRETKEGPVYLLVRTNKPLKLEETKDKDKYPWVGSVGGGMIIGDGLRATNAPMKLVAERLSPYVGRPVLDQTGLTGAFDFKYATGADDAAPEDLISSIMRSVEALGLKLEPGRGPVEMLVIDDVKKPAAN